MKELTKNGYEHERFSNEPSYKKYGVKLIDFDSLEEDSIDRISLKDLFKELKNQELID